MQDKESRLADTIVVYRGEFAFLTSPFVLGPRSPGSECPLQPGRARNRTDRFPPNSALGTPR
ncbi:MAG: hypothetical protein P4L50_14335 [Anaerolineaceae bacterium]|nr:hypothetical protein [Anaerolineaceae bacterium]